MGEYAKRKSDGEEVKIGTCENMYYLRFSQRGDVEKVQYSLDPTREAPALRFRFPWPDEDGLQPGEYPGVFPEYPVPGYTTPKDGQFEHNRVRFHTGAGSHDQYSVFLPCPEDRGKWREELPATEAQRARIGLAHPLLLAQKFVPAVGLVPILRCPACGAMYREEDRHEIEKIALAFRGAGNTDSGSAEWNHAVADRILAGIAAQE